jgi:hypothetical protein
MNYRAARRIVTIPQGKDNLVIYEIGDPIPEFAQWAEVIQRAHINQGLVEMDITPPIIGEPLAPIMPLPQDDETAKAPPPEPKKRGRKPKAQAALADPAAQDDAQDEDYDGYTDDGADESNEGDTQPPDDDGTEG